MTGQDLAYRARNFVAGPQLMSLDADLIDTRICLNKWLSSNSTRSLELLRDCRPKSRYSFSARSTARSFIAFESGRAQSEKVQSQQRYANNPPGWPTAPRRCATPSHSIRRLSVCALQPNNHKLRCVSAEHLAFFFGHLRKMMTGSEC